MSLLAALLALLVGTTPAEGRRIAAAPSWESVHAWVAEPGLHCIRVRQTGVSADRMAWMEDLHIGDEWVTEWIGTGWPLSEPVPVDAMPGGASLPLDVAGMMIGWERVGAGIVMQVIPFAMGECPRLLLTRSMLGTVRR